jgi:hypothetical protein
MEQQKQALVFGTWDPRVLMLTPATFLDILRPIYAKGNYRIKLSLLLNIDFGYSFLF